MSFLNTFVIYLQQLQLRKLNANQVVPFLASWIIWGTKKINVDQVKRMNSLDMVSQLLVQKPSLQKSAILLNRRKVQMISETENF